jgi:general secretion pathway protein G
MTQKNKGFTLLELLVVMAILGILAVLVLPKITDKPKQAKRLKAVLQIKAFQDALEGFYVDHGYYPSTDDGLKDLLIPREGKTSYLDSPEIPLDPWNSPYQYISPGLSQRPYDIVAFGQDKRRGGSGWDKDVESWDLDRET